MRPRAVNTASVAIQLRSAEASFRLADALEHAHEDVLDDVRNFGIDAERACHQPLDQRFVALDQHRARRAIPAVEGRDQLGIVVIGSRPAIEGMRAGAHLTREGHRNRHITLHDLSPLGPKAAHPAAGNLSRVSDGEHE